MSIHLQKHMAETDCGSQYIALNKPIDFTDKKETDQSIFKLLTKDNNISRYKKTLDLKKIRLAANLDADAEGLVILTNDNNFITTITDCEKEYEIMINRPLARDAKKVLSLGMKTDNNFLPGIIIAREFNKGRRTLVNVIVNHENTDRLKTMFERLGYPVLALKRVRIGKLKLSALPTGKWRLIKKEYAV